MRAWIRCKGINDGYDTDEESEIQRIQQMDIEVGTKTPPPMFAGLVPLDYGGEVNDCGEEAYWRSKMLNRAVRRMDRWEGGKGVVRTKKSKRRDLTWMESNGHAEEDEDEDDEMQDVDDMERREKEEMDSDEEEEVYDRHNLPSLSSLGHA
jgi:Ino eighty subunit 1